MLRPLPLKIGMLQLCILIDHTIHTKKYDGVSGLFLKVSIQSSRIKQSISKNGIFNTEKTKDKSESKKRHQDSSFIRVKPKPCILRPIKKFLVGILMK